MCKISDNIKFCSCVDANTDVEELNHYWVLNRYNKYKNLEIEILGELRLPLDEFTPNYIENGINISKALTKTDCFDKPITFKEKDRLQIVLNNNDEVMVFEYEYTSGAWLSIENKDPFYLSNNFDEINFGEVKEDWITQE